MQEAAALPPVIKYLCVPKCKCPPEGDADKEMVACDTKRVGADGEEHGCPYGEWYHYKCLQLNKTTVRKAGQWFCPRCQFD